MMKIKIMLMMAMFSTPIFAEVIFYNDITIKDVIIEKERSETYFEEIKCGLYHCYGIKDKNLYAAGFNRYGQLGTKDYESRDKWELVVKGNVESVSPYRFGGCVYLDNGLKYQTGRIEETFEVIKPKQINKWTETNKCLTEKSH